jgi:hypothetical protein
VVNRGSPLGIFWIAAVSCREIKGMRNPSPISLEICGMPGGRHAGPRPCAYATPHPLLSKLKAGDWQILDHRPPSPPSPPPPPPPTESEMTLTQIALALRASKQIYLTD